MNVPQGGRKDALLAEINVTPLVDVMLVLLIIFMVTAPMMQFSTDVSLPKVSAPPMPGDENHLVVTLDKKGNLYIGKNLVDGKLLAERVRAFTQERGVTEAYLRADKEVSTGRVMELMSVMRKSGVKRLGMITEPLEQR